jgi:RimJ/RimL family protein N-acetyltransferase
MEAVEFYTKNIVLENERVKWIPFNSEYRQGLKDIIFDEFLSRFSVNCKTDTELDNYIERTTSQRDSLSAYPFIVIDKLTNRVAGSTRFGNIQFHNKRLEIGWTWNGKNYRGTGLNKACKYELLKYAFEELLFRRVQLSTDIDNIQSQKAIEKIGATREGIFRSNYINSLGESRDDIYYSIIHSEWPGIKKTIFKEYM